VDNINQDKQKLLSIMRELKKDYEAGNISESKYKYLSNEYSSRIANLDATNRIRAMQGRGTAEKSKSSSVQRSMAEASKKEDQNLIDKYVVKPKENKNIKKTVPVSNKGKYAILAVVCLIGAFLVGISFGLFTGPQTTIPSASVMVDDTAFPDFLINATNSTINNSSQTNTDVSVDTNSSDGGSDSGDSNNDSGNDNDGQNNGDNSNSGDSNSGNSGNSDNSGNSGNSGKSGSETSN